jgi:hypothetical protein
VTPEQIFELWAPERARWSKWAKPVLFAHLDAVKPAPAAPVEHATVEPATIESTAVEPTTVEPATVEPAPPPPPRLTGVPPADGATAVVVDLPGASGVSAGLLLAEAGYRPVPLYNAVPSPRAGATISRGPVVVDTAEALDALRSGDEIPRASVVVDLTEVLDALRSGATRLATLRVADEAPPAFLLDARRRIGDLPVLRPGDFDNRSVSLPTDFPSANLLLASGIRRVVVVQPDEGQPQADLAHTLRRWQDAGIEVLVLAASTATATATATAPDAYTAAGNQPQGVSPSPRPITINKPRWYRHFWHGMLARLGLRPSPLGGFGGFLPVESAG